MPQEVRRSIEQDTFERIQNTFRRRLYVHDSVNNVVETEYSNPNPNFKIQVSLLEGIEFSSFIDGVNEFTHNGLSYHLKTNNVSKKNTDDNTYLVEFQVQKE